MGAPGEGPGTSPSWARKFSALPPVPPALGHAAQTLETSKPGRVLAASESLDSRIGQTWVQVPALLWGLGQVALFL